MRSVYRVNWLRASARYQRWDEEVTLVRHEMKWTVSFFHFKKEQWRHLATGLGNSAWNKGLQSYAYKQANTWSAFESKAQQAFAKVIGNDSF